MTWLGDKAPGQSRDEEGAEREAFTSHRNTLGVTSKGMSKGSSIKFPGPEEAPVFWEKEFTNRWGREVGLYSSDWEHRLVAGEWPLRQGCPFAGLEDSLPCQDLPSAWRLGGCTPAPQAGRLLWPHRCAQPSGF